MTGPRTALAAVLVVVPAHDEEDRIGGCLESVSQAASELVRVLPHVTVDVTVVLDRCTDGTASVVERATTGELQAHSVAVDAGCVGRARRAGVAHAAARHPDLDPRAVLVVNTDADCLVPVTWLVEHAELAGSCDLVLGEVEPDPTEMDAAALAAWWQRHPRGRGSLHGANLSCRLDAYLRAGGFPDVAVQEDVLLVRAMRANGAAVIGGTRVTTSARRHGRVADGFAGYLRTLDLDLARVSGAQLSAYRPECT